MEMTFEMYCESKGALLQWVDTPVVVKFLLLFCDIGVCVVIVGTFFSVRILYRKVSSHGPLALDKCVTVWALKSE